MSDLAKKEEERIFCIHDIEHCLDVARISYILALENDIKIDKDIVYGAALLHDIGRAISVENHEIESVRTARDILKKCEYTENEINLICNAIESHREKSSELKDLSDILAVADKISRQCYSCKAVDQCNWRDSKKKYGDRILMIIGNREFKDRTYVMGILNVTPDSFSDGSKYNTIDRALKHTEEMIKDGMDIVDVGGESTRPGYTMISDEEEISRVVPVVEKIKAEFDIPISVDTYKSGVAKAAINAGADLINDIWGFKYDENMAQVVKDGNVSCCLMHNRKEMNYTDYMNDVLNDLKESIAKAKAVGIDDNRICTDPGVGFAKTYEQNLEIINKLEMLNTLGYPVLLGTSKKSVIGLTLDLPSDERVEGTIATSVLAVVKNSLFVRVHNVKENKRAILMTEKILGKY